MARNGRPIVKFCFWLAGLYSMCVSFNAQAVDNQSASEKALFIRQVEQISFDVCPELPQKPAGKSDLDIVRQHGFSVRGKLRDQDLLHLMPSASAHIYVGTSVNVVDNSLVCTEILNSEFNADAVGAVKSKLLQHGYVFSDNKFMKNSFKFTKVGGMGVYFTVENDGQLFSYVAAPDKPVTAITFSY